MMMLHGTVCLYVWCSILKYFFSDAACAGNIAGFDTLDTAGCYDNYPLMGTRVTLDSIMQYEARPDFCAG